MMRTEVYEKINMQQGRSINLLVLQKTGKKLGRLIKKEKHHK